jgi:hypothetical protein
VKQRSIALAALVLLFVATSLRADDTPKHPGTETNCVNLQADVCKKWEQSVSSTELGDTGTETWVEKRRRDGSFTSEDHYIYLSHPNGDSDRVASSYSETTVVPDGRTHVSTIRELRYHYQGIKFVETCRSDAMSPLSTETHEIRQLSSKEQIIDAALIRWIHSDSIEKTERQKWDPEKKRFENAASLKDETRCSVAGFPFAQLRDPKLKPLAGW